MLWPMEKIKLCISEAFSGIGLLGKEKRVHVGLFFLVGNVIFFYSKMFSTLFVFHLKLADSATVYLKKCVHVLNFVCFFFLQLATVI